MAAATTTQTSLSLGGTVDAASLPDFDDLPAVDGMPQGCAWGVWGKDDQLGTLNLLTPTLVAHAARENIQSGDRVQIDWGLDSVDFPANKRKHLHHRIIDLKKELGVYATDDELHLNTQTSSQWDGFNHFAHQATGMYYNGLKHSDLHGGVVDKADKNSMHQWCLNGGIAGRGVLVDWVHWWESTKPTDQPIPPANSSYPIPLSQIKQVLEWQGTVLKPGDILLLRTGVVRWFESASDQDKIEGFIRNDNFPGIEATEEVKRWLWNNHFAAVGADNPSFEFGPHGDIWLHDWLLPMWGCPIGELFDLERLSAACRKHQRWSFFFTSAPYRVKGGIASSPNALCVF